MKANLLVRPDRYICGWVVYYILNNVQNDTQFYLGKMTTSVPFAHKKAVAHEETIVFKNEKEAKGAAEELRKTVSPPNRIFYREMVYETPNVENTKGMKEIGADYRVKIIELK